MPASRPRRARAVARPPPRHPRPGHGGTVVARRRRGPPREPRAPHVSPGTRPPEPGRRRSAGSARRLESASYFLGGAVLLLRREALADVGGLDERFFLQRGRGLAEASLCPGLARPATARRSPRSTAPAGPNTTLSGSNCACTPGSNATSGSGTGRPGGSRTGPAPSWATAGAVFSDGGHAAPPHCASPGCTWPDRTGPASRAGAVPRLQP